MSRKNRSNKQRRTHREKAHAQREAKRNALPSAPARWNLFGYARKGDAAKLAINFTQPVTLSEEQQVLESSQEVRDARLIQAWNASGNHTKGDA